MHYDWTQSAFGIIVIWLYLWVGEEGQPIGPILLEALLETLGNGNGQPEAGGVFKIAWSWDSSWSRCCCSCFKLNCPA